jgi:uncharacterized protein DUF1707
MRASDGDREWVAAILRRQYEAGRVDDDDLERRLSQGVDATRLRGSTSGTATTRATTCSATRG